MKEIFELLDSNGMRIYNVDISDEERLNNLINKYKNFEQIPKTTIIDFGITKNNKYKKIKNKFSNLFDLYLEIKLNAGDILSSEFIPDGRLRVVFTKKQLLSNKLNSNDKYQAIYDLLYFCDDVGENILLEMLECFNLNIIKEKQIDEIMKNRDHLIFSEIEINNFDMELGQARRNFEVVNDRNIYFDKPKIKRK